MGLHNFICGFAAVLIVSLAYWHDMRKPLR